MKNKYGTLGFNCTPGECRKFIIQGENGTPVKWEESVAAMSSLFGQKIAGFARNTTHCNENNEIIVTSKKGDRLKSPPYPAVKCGACAFKESLKNEH